MKFNTAYDGDDLREKDRRHTVHGWTEYSQFLQNGPEILVEGDGVYVTDLYGNRLMDAMAGVWCVNHVAEERSEHPGRPDSGWIVARLNRGTAHSHLDAGTARTAPCSAWTPLVCRSP